MNMFLTIMIIFGLLVGVSVLTYKLATQETLRTLKNYLLEAKKEGKGVSVTVDNLKISISSKDLKIKVLTD